LPLVSATWGALICCSSSSTTKLFGAIAASDSEFVNGLAWRDFQHFQLGVVCKPDPHSDDIEKDAFEVICETWKKQGL
jgi:hypothetical protein